MPWSSVHLATQLMSVVAEMTQWSGLDCLDRELINPSAVAPHFPAVRRQSLAALYCTCEARGAV